MAGETLSNGDRVERDSHGGTAEGVAEKWTVP
jgi:hypothetical protein